MESILDDLHNKQELVSNYLVQNYKVSGGLTFSGPAKILDKWSNEQMYGEEIVDDILMFYPFGEVVIKIVVDVWLNYVGFNRESIVWERPLNYRNAISEEYYRRMVVNPNDFDEPIRVMTYMDLPYGQYRGPDEYTLVRRLAQNIMREVPNHINTSILNNCTSIDDLDYAMNLIGFERIETASITGIRVNWCETESSFRRRRLEHYQ